MSTTCPRALVVLLLATGCIQTPVSGVQSVGDASFAGKRHFFAFGEGRDAGNATTSHAAELRFDLGNMRSLFASPGLGAYAGESVIAEDADGASQVIARLDDMVRTVGSGDMYVQYSGSHGAPSTATENGGLPAFRMDWDAVAEKILAIPAKEVVVFTMSCYSGGLIAALEARSDVWIDRRSQGRTLFVMSSSTGSETSSTSKNGTTGVNDVQVWYNGGSAFGSVLASALKGDADLNGDGKITLGEIAQHVPATTKKSFGHTPMVTGSYDEGLVMVDLKGGATAVDAGAAPRESVAKAKAYDGMRQELLTMTAEYEKVLKEFEPLLQDGLNASFEEYYGEQEQLVAAIEAARADIERESQACAASMTATTSASTSSSTFVGGGSGQAAQETSACPAVDAAVKAMEKAEAAMDAHMDKRLRQYMSESSFARVSALRDRRNELAQKIQAQVGAMQIEYLAYLESLDAITGTKPLQAAVDANQGGNALPSGLDP